jgi:hypothetical protein
MGWAELGQLAYALVIGAGGGAATLVLAAFTKLGDFVLLRRVEAFKNQLIAETERLKADLANVGDRRTRSNEREFAAIIAVWECFMEAYVHTNIVAMAFSRHPDFTAMSDEDAEDFLKSQDFSEVQRREVMNMHRQDRNRAFVRVVEFRNLGKASRAIFDAHDTLRKQSVFLPKEIEDAFMKRLKLFSEVRAYQEVRRTDGYIQGIPNAPLIFIETEEKLVEGMKQIIRDRITDHNL